MLAIFNDEISSLEQQLAVITAQIDALRIAETKAEQAKAYLIDLIDTVQPLGKLEDIKRLVLALFGSDDNGGNGGSDTPTPDNPTPDDQQLTPIEQAIATITTAEVEAEDIDTTDIDQPAPTMAELEAMAEEQSNDYCQLMPISDRVAYLERDIDGAILYTYAGFSRKDVAESWGRFLLKLPNVSYELRLAKRLTSFKWELKIKNLTLSQIDRFSKEDLSKAHRPEVNSATPPESPLPEKGYTLVEDNNGNSVFRQWRCYVGKKFLGYVTESLQPGHYRHDKCRNATTLFDDKDAAAEHLVNIYKHEQAVHERTVALFNPLAS